MKPSGGSGAGSSVLSAVGVLLMRYRLRENGVSQTADSRRDPNIPGQKQIEGTAGHALLPKTMPSSHLCAKGFRVSKIALDGFHLYNG